MIVLDTSFLFAYFQKDDVNHKEAFKLAKELDYTNVLIPIEVFEELMTVITYKVSSVEAVTVGEILLHEESPIQLMETNFDVFHYTWKHFQDFSPHSFSFVDCLLIALSYKFSCKVLTFDKKIVKFLKK